MFAWQTAKSCFFVSSLWRFFASVAARLRHRSFSAWQAGVICQVKNPWATRKICRECGILHPLLPEGRSGKALQHMRGSPAAFRENLPRFRAERPVVYGKTLGGFSKTFGAESASPLKEKEASFIHQETSLQQLGYQDSNLEKQDQNLLCYHYTISHSVF